MPSVKDHLILLNDNGWRDDYTVSSAACYVANESTDLDGCVEKLALMIGAILETMPPDEILRVLNASSRRTWRIAP